MLPEDQESLREIVMYAQSYAERSLTIVFGTAADGLELPQLELLRDWLDDVLAHRRASPYEARANAVSGEPERPHDSR